MKLLGDGTHRLLQHAVDAVLDVDRVVLRLDVDVARAALNRGVDRRVDEADDRADVAREPLDGQAVLAALLFLEQLQLEALRGVLEDALRALALLEYRLDGRARAHHDLDRRGEQHAELVDHREVGRVGHDDHEVLAVAPVRHEAVPQHQVRGDGTKQILIDPERLHVDELEAVSFGEAARLLEFDAALVGAELHHIRRKRMHRVRTHDSTELSWKSGM